MNYQTEKRKLIEGVVNDKITQDRFISYAHMMCGEGIPRELLEKWKKRYYADLKLEYPQTPRLINKFSLGADPEYIFASRDGNYLSGSDFGLNVFEAFGCDVGGRQGELRAHPSRFVLDVVASLVDTLRWQMAVIDNLGQARWLAPAYFKSDGCGGHVHFGTRRKVGEKVWHSLDSAVMFLEKLNITDAKGNIQRISASHYGKPTDYRVQPHGYEYRTMPSWLSSPKAAYLSLVLSKLCMYHPMDHCAVSVASNQKNWLAVKNLLRAYQNVDDDARICLSCIELFGINEYPGEEDIKRVWGVPPWEVRPILLKEEPFVGLLKNSVSGPKFIDKNSLYIPSTIPPEETTKRELFDFMMKNTPLPRRFPKEPTWGPLTMPKDMYRYSGRAYGMTDILQNVLIWKYGLNCAHIGTQAISIKGPFPDDPHFWDIWRARFESRHIAFRTYSALSNGKSFFIELPTSVCRANPVRTDVMLVKDFLLNSGLFPMFPAREYKSFDSLAYESRLKLQKKIEPKLVGKVIQTIEGGLN